MPDIRVGETGMIQAIKKLGVENSLEYSEFKLSILCGVVPQVLEFSHLLIAGRETILEVQTCGGCYCC